MKAFLRASVRISLLAAFAAVARADGEEGSRVEIKKVTAGDTEVRVVQHTGVAPAAPKVDRDVAAPAQVGATQVVAAPEKGPHKARLAVLPAVFADHLKSSVKISEAMTVTGNIDFKALFTTEHERRWEAPSFTLSLSEAFVNCRKFDVLERARLAEVTREVDFGASDYGDQAKVVPLGKALNAEYVALPEIEVVHVVLESREIPYVGERRVRWRAKMIARVRVVDVSTTRVVAAVTEETQVERLLNASNTFALSEGVNLIMNLYATEGQRMVQRTIEAIYPVRIVDITDGKVLINRGEGAVNVGDEFEVFNTGKPVTDPDTGEVLGAREESVGKLKVIRVMPKMAEAEITGGASALLSDAAGLVCRETKASTEARTRVPADNLAW